MRRHLKGGNTDLKTGRNYSFLILFLILPQNISAQIPINGFCEYNSYQVPSGYEHCLPVDINSDSYSEIILYSSSKKKIAIVSGLMSRNNLLIKEYPLLFEISQLEPLKNKDRYVFSSRQNRLMGLLKISGDEKPNIISKLDFDSFPENVDVGDVNNYGVEEFLISGSGFDGISLIYQYKGRLGESKIVGGSSFCFSTLIDLSNDGFYDIVTCNLLESSLQFYYNDGEGNFNLMRSLPSDKKFYGINSYDVDNDTFEDLVVSNSGSITILYGDFQSSYKEKVVIKVKHIPEEVLPGDFNQDGFTDLAYVDYTNGALSVIFGNDGREFYKEVLYRKKDGLTDVHQSNNALWFLSDDGQLFSIERFDGFTKNVNFVPAVNPTAIQHFDNAEDGVTDICFIDSYKSELNLLIRDETGIPSLYYTIPVSSDHKEIIADVTTSEVNIFYCFTKGSRLLEIIKTDFENEIIERKQLYSPGDIRDLKVKRVDSTSTNIFITYNNNNRFVLGKFEYRDLSVTFKEYPFVDRNVLHSELIAAEEPIIYYWKEYSDTLYYKKAVIKTGPNEYDNIISLAKTDSVVFSSISADLVNNGSSDVISVIRTGESNFSLVSDSWMPDVSFPLIFPERLNIKDENQLFFSFINSGSEKNLIVYSPGQKSLGKVDLSNTSKRLNFTKLFDSVDAADYFIESIFPGKYHFVFSNKREGCISLIQLKK
ncbi:MAG: VCBS repeat-containing protein [Ignavibacteriaceae bacterium]